VDRLDFRDHRALGEHMPAKIPKDDIEKLKDLINPVTISKGASDLSYKIQNLATQISKLMALHTSLADSMYLKRTQSDIIERRRQAQLALVAYEAAEAEKQRQREEDDAVAIATRASLEEAAGVKSKKRRRGG